MAGSVNFVWNYCNQTAIEYLDKHNKWLSRFDLHKLTSGCTKELGLVTRTVETVCYQYVIRRKQVRRRKLRWRSRKRSLGWVPFTKDAIRVVEDRIVYNKTEFRFWKSRDIVGAIKSGTFTQDARGNWYVCITTEIDIISSEISNKPIGIDLGVKTIATMSNGDVFGRENLTKKYENKLSKAQRARKRKQVTSIYAKIRNTRSDWNHKQTTKIAQQYGYIYIGDVSSSELIKRTNISKSISDAGWYQFKTMLKYKADALGVVCKEVNEAYSTVTCSSCLQRTGPTGEEDLNVREWTCNCGATHDRDVNAAKNILRFGCESLN